MFLALLFFNAGLGDAMSAWKQRFGCHGVSIGHRITTAFDQHSCTSVHAANFVRRIRQGRIRIIFFQNEGVHHAGDECCRRGHCER